MSQKSYNNTKRLQKKQLIKKIAFTDLALAFDYMRNAKQAENLSTAGQPAACLASKPQGQIKGPPPRKADVPETMSDRPQGFNGRNIGVQSKYWNIKNPEEVIFGFLSIEKIKKSKLYTKNKSFSLVYLWPASDETHKRKEATYSCELLQPCAITEPEKRLMRPQVKNDNSAALRTPEDMHSASKVFQMQKKDQAVAKETAAKSVRLNFCQYQEPWGKSLLATNKDIVSIKNWNRKFTWWKNWNTQHRIEYQGVFKYRLKPENESSQTSRPYSAQHLCKIKMDEFKRKHTDMTRINEYAKYWTHKWK